MQRQTVVGPPRLAWAAAAIAVVVAVVVGLPSDGVVSTLVVVVAALAVWRLLSLSVWIAGKEVVVRNLVRTHRVPVARARVSIEESTRLVAGSNTPNRLPVYTEVPRIPGVKYQNVHCYLRGGDSVIRVACLAGRTPERFHEGARQLADAIEEAKGQGGRSRR